MVSLTIFTPINLMDQIIILEFRPHPNIISSSPVFLKSIKAIDDTIIGDSGITHYEPFRMVV